MAEATERRFEAAVNVVKSMPKKGAYQPSYDTMLKFYGYFKQAKEGECTDAKPGFWDVIKKAKWEAWSALGDLPQKDAMQGYVDEVKKVMESMPDNEEMADFSQVLKDFYEVVYEPSGEEPPPMLRIFKKDDSQMPANGFVSDDIYTFNESAPDGSPGERHVASVDSLSQLTKITSHGYTNGAENDERGLSNGNDSEEDIVLKDISLEASHPLYVVEVGDKKKKSKGFDDSGFASELQGNGNGQVPSHTSHISEAYPSNGISLNEKEPISATSDESDEEFCDSLDPEHLRSLQNGDNIHLANGLPLDALDSTSSSETSTKSPLTESDVSDVETPNPSYERFTSTPFSKKAVHVTFADDVKEITKNESKASVNRKLIPENNLTDGIVPMSCQECQASPSETVDGTVVEGFGGILKPRQAGSGYKGGACRSGQGSSRQGDQANQGQKANSGRARNPESVPSGSRGYRDSDSDTDNEHPDRQESGESSTERDVNERILVALEKLQQDMNRVLRRLRTMEDTVPTRTDGVSSSPVSPWWYQYIPSKTVMLLIVWPLVLNFACHYYRRKRANR